MTTTQALRTVEPGTLVTIRHQGHPRNGQIVTTLRPVDRGEMKNRAGFTGGVWVTTGTHSIPLWADTQVEINKEI